MRNFSQASITPSHGVALFCAPWGGAGRRIGVPAGAGDIGSVAQIAVSRIILLLSLMCSSEAIIGFACHILLSESAGVPRFLEWVGAWENPRSLSPIFSAMMIGLVYLGFSIVSLILFPSVARRDCSIEEVAVTLGTTPVMVFFKVLVPTFRTSLIAVTLSMFVYLLGVFVMPTMLGRPKDWTMAVIISDKALGDANLPLAAALAVAMLIVTVIVLFISAGATRGRQA